MGVGFFAILPALVLPALLSRLLPPADLAAWLYAFSIGTYVLSFHMGVGPATSTLVAREVDAPAARAALLFTATGLTLLAAMTASALLIGATLAGLFDANAAANLNQDLFHRTLVLAIAATSLSLPLQTYYAYCSGVFDVGRFVPINLLQKLSMISFIALAAWLARDALSVALAYLASALLSFAVCATMVWRELGPHRRSVVPQFLPRARTMLVYSIPAALSGLATIPLTGVHAVIVAREVPQSIVAFTALLPVLALIAGMAWSILGNLLSEFSAGFGAAAQSDQALSPASFQIVERSTAFVGLGVVAGQIGLCALLPAVLQWIVGSQWQFEQLATLAAYCAAFLLRLQLLPMSLSFYALGRPWLGQIPAWTEAILSLSLTLALAPRFGIAGIAAGMLISIAVNALISGLLLTRRGAAGASPWPQLRPVVVALLASTLLIAACHAAVAIAGDSAITYLALVGFAGLLILPVYWFAGLDRNHATQALLMLSQLRSRLGGSIRRA